MKLVVKPVDVLRSKVIEPGWYLARITKAVDKPAKTDGSMNSELSFEIVSPSGGGTTPFKGVPVSNVFNEKFPGFAIEFIEAMGGKVSESSTVEFEIGPKLVGKPIEINVNNELYQTRMLNKIIGFRPAPAAQGVPAS